MLVALAALSMWIVAFNLRLAAEHGLVWTGIDGEFPVDQMQYLAWVQDASRHVLVSDLFVLRPTPHDYLQPMLAISGGLTAAGVAPWLALLVWKPVAVGAIFFAVRGYCRRALGAPWEWRAALVLGLFAAWFGALGDEWTPFMSWGYPFALIALAAMVGALVAYDRTLRDNRGSWAAPALGLIAGWLHPWQGGLLIILVLGGELTIRATSGRHQPRRSIALPAMTIGAAAVPLVYYVLLARLDPAWRFASTLTMHRPVLLSSVLLPLAPMLVIAATAYLRRPKSFIGATARLWPLGALVIWQATKSNPETGPLHAWAGVTVPLAVLAVEGVQGLGFRRLPAHRWIGALAVAALTIPGSYLIVRAVPTFVAISTHNQNLIRPSERRAFQYLSQDPRPGGVLSTYRLGDAVPGETGRHTYFGDYRWAGADYRTREQMAWKLLHRGLSTAAARRFVLGSGARFVLADCRSRANLARILAPTKVNVRRFGCTIVYELR